MARVTTELLERARFEAARQYALAHDSWSEQEQLLVHEGRVIEAQGAREMARRALRAWFAEQHDPEPAA